MIIGFYQFGLSAVGQTFASFNDTEVSEGNVYQAGTLDFSLNDTDFDESIGLDETILLSSVLTNSGSLDFQYTVEAKKISGSDEFCNALLLEAKLNGVKQHDENLMPFSASSTKRGTWKFNIEMPVSATNIPHGDVCEIDLVFKGWQTDVANYGDSGFFDEERIHIRLTSRMIVLNEFLPRPSGIEYGFDFGDDNSDMPEGEWVEIYNNSDYDFDLADWYIKDDLDTDTNKIMITAANTYPATTLIGAKSWLVVYMNKAVLNNTGDTVKLFDNTDTLIDSYTYTVVSDYCDIEPTPGDENTTDTSGSCAGVPSNKSYARIPDGIGDWVDPVPTPGTANIMEQEDGQERGVSVIETAEQAPDIEIIEQPASAEEETAVEIQDEQITDEQEPAEAPESDSDIITDKIAASTDEMIIKETEEVIAEPTELTEIEPEPQPEADNPLTLELTIEPEPELVDPPAENSGDKN